MQAHRVRDHDRWARVVCMKVDASSRPCSHCSRETSAPLSFYSSLPPSLALAPPSPPDHTNSPSPTSTPPPLQPKCSVRQVKDRHAPAPSSYSGTELEGAAFQRLAANVPGHPGNGSSGGTRFHRLGQKFWAAGRYRKSHGTSQGVFTCAPEHSDV